MSCFALLKWAYGSKIANMVRHAVTHITKINFLAAFQKAYFEAIKPDNIKSSFGGAGLILFNPEAVVLQLDVCL